MITRLVTAIVFVAVVIGGLYGNSYSFIALFILTTALCLWEFLTLVLEEKGKKRNYVRLSIAMMFGMLPIIIVSLSKLKLIHSFEETVLNGLLLIFPLLFLYFIYELFAAAEKPFQNIAYVILAIVYIGIPFALVDIIAFRNEQFYVNTIFGLLVLTWANDTGAYVVGSQIGKTPLFPRISPNKTWEGSTGGAVISLIIAAVLSYFFKELSLTNWLILGAIVAIFGSIGDLIESMLKRSFQIKDSGGLLPGHGGFLDRFDAFLFLIPFAYTYLLWIM